MTLQGDMICSILLTKYYLGDQIKENEMGRVCGIYRRQERCI